MQLPSATPSLSHHWENPKTGTTFALHIEQQSICLKVMAANGHSTIVACRSIEEALELAEAL